MRSASTRQAKLPASRACVLSLWAVFASLLLCGCAGLGHKLEAPQINLAHIAVKEVRPLETEFWLDLRVFNTNDVALVVEGLDCQLEVDGRKLATGVSEASVRIPPFSSERLRILVYTSSLDMLGTFLDRLRKLDKPDRETSLAYRLSGRLHLGGRAFPDTIPFSSQGQLDLGSLPAPSEQ